MDLNLYQILGVKNTANDDEIKKAYEAKVGLVSKSANQITCLFSKIPRFERFVNLGPLVHHIDSYSLEDTHT